MPESSGRRETKDPRLSRRGLLQRCAGAIAAGAWLARPDAWREDGAAAGDDGTLDEALERLHAGEPRIRGGLSTHLPMAAEALCALGLAAELPAWLGRQGVPRSAIPEPSRRIDPARWRETLGRDGSASTWAASIGRYGDWRLHFEEQLEEARWQEVLDTWTGRLAPGLCAAATHGVIRTAHAARALSRRETAPRRAELARGLAYWAAAYQELPARERAEAQGRCSFADALAKLPLYREANGRAPAGNIVNGLREAGALDGFDAVRDLAAPVDDAGAALSDLTSTFANVYLRHGTKEHTIAFVHAVTGPAALRKLAPHVSPGTARAALPYAWQAAAGIYSAYATRANEARPVRAEPTLDRAALAARALRSGDVHAIKFTEALLAEDAVRPDPAYRAAAEDVVARL